MNKYKAVYFDRDNTLTYKNKDKKLYMLNVSEMEPMDSFTLLSHLKDFYLDEGLKDKLESLWEEPTEKEYDIIYISKEKKEK